MSKKTIIGGLLIVVAVVCVVAWVIFGLDANPQEMYRNFPQDAGQRLAEINTMRNLALMAALLFGAGGVALVIIGQRQKKAILNS